jgi:hypothetical protein
MRVPYVLLLLLLLWLCLLQVLLVILLQCWPDAKLRKPVPWQQRKAWADAMLLLCGRRLGGQQVEAGGRYAGLEDVATCCCYGCCCCCCILQWPAVC